MIKVGSKCLQAADGVPEGSAGCELNESHESELLPEAKSAAASSGFVPLLELLKNMSGN